MSKIKPTKSKTPVVTTTNTNPQTSVANTDSPVATPQIAMPNGTLHKIIVFVFGCLLYANTLGFDHAIDDAIVITDNEYTQQGLSGIGGILGADTFEGFFGARDNKDGNGALVEGGRYRPMSLLLFAAEMQLFGKPMKDKKGNEMKVARTGEIMKGIAGIGHFGNMLLYGLTGVLLYMVLLLLFRRNTGDEQSEASDTAQTIALVATLIFLAHPVHTEAVANIKGADEILSLLGSLGALWLTLKAFYKNNTLYLTLSGVVFFMACMSKENAVAFLAITPLAFWVFSNPKISDIIKHTLPLLVGAMAFIAIRYNAIGFGFAANPPLEMMNNPFVVLNETTRLYEYMPFADKMATIMYSLNQYIGLLFAPITLTHDYYPRHIAVMTFANPAALFALVVHIGLVAYAAWGCWKKQPMAFAVAFYLLSLFMVSNIIFAVGTNMAERFLYMPSVGFAMAIAIILTRFIKNKTLILGITAVICLAFGAKTVLRNPVWYDTFTLFMADSETSVNSAKLQNACGGEMQRIASLTDRERLEWLKQSSLPELVEIAAIPDSNARQQRLLARAQMHLANTLRIHPTYGNAWLLKGNASYYQKDYENAIKSYRECIRLNAEVNNAKRNLGCALRDYARKKGEGDHDAAAAETLAKEALTYLSDDDETYRLLGIAYGIQRKNAEALAVFEQWVAKKPNSAQAHLNLSVAYNVAGNPARAAEEKGKAMALDKNIR
jgi:protein O-mannosyl-transferase